MSDAPSDEIHRPLTTEVDLATTAPGAVGHHLAQEDTLWPRRKLLCKYLVDLLRCRTAALRRRCAVGRRKCESLLFVASLEPGLRSDGSHHSHASLLRCMHGHGQSPPPSLSLSPLYPEQGGYHGWSSGLLAAMNPLSSISSVPARTLKSEVSTVTVRLQSALCCAAAMEAKRAHEARGSETRLPDMLPRCITDGQPQESGSCTRSQPRSQAKQSCQANPTLEDVVSPTS